MTHTDAKCVDIDIDAHKKYLAQVTPDVVRRRLKLFRLEEEVMERLPFRCQSLVITPFVRAYERWLHPIDPISLDDVKNWYGVPNEVARQRMSMIRATLDSGPLCGPMERVDPSHLPMQRHFNFCDLEPVQQTAVRQMATNLLYGYIDPKDARQPPYIGVINYMLNRAAGLKVFVAPDLIVCPDDVVVFESIPALIFNNILIYDGGEVVVKSHTSIHAYQIRHVNTTHS